MTTLYHYVQLPLFPSKPCSICGDEKPLIEFPKAPTCKDGYRSCCKNCYYQQSRPQQQNYHATHREQARQYDRNRRAARSPEKKAQIVQQSREWRNRNAEHVRQMKRADYARNAEKLQQRQRNYRVEHPDRVHQSTHKSYARNVEAIRTRNKAWRQANTLSIIERNKRRIARERNNAIGEVSYKRILERDGMHCYICEKPILPEHKIHFDHVIPLARGGAHSEDNIKPTHQVCNLRKHHNLLSEMTPHQRRGV